jgi:hypothetical protein
MTSPTLTHATEPSHAFAVAASSEQIERAARALVANNFTVEILDDAESARARVAAVLLLRRPIGF